MAVDQTVFARLYVEIGGQWQYQQISFAAAWGGSSLTYPTSGQIPFSKSAQGYDVTQPFAWTATAGAQAYWVAIGSWQGSADVVSSGQLPASQTSWYLPISLAPGGTYYARLFTEVGGQWQFQDIVFTTGNSVVFTYPTSGQQNVDLTKPFKWTATGTAQAYWVTIGSTLGARDLASSGALPASQSSWQVPASLPTAQTLYARIWTEVGGQWQYQDSPFTVGSTSTSTSGTGGVTPSSLTYPTSGQQNVDPTKPFTWNATTGAQGYEVTIGTSQGAADVVDSGSLPASQTSWLVPTPLPTGKTLYARLSTEISGQWQYQDISFTAAANSVAFTYPTAGQQNVDTTKPFSWSGASAAQGYRVTIGTSQGAADVVDSGSLPASQTSWLVPIQLPTGKTLYARLYTEISGQWQYQDISFTAASSSTSTSTSTSTGSGPFTYPSDGQQGVDTTKPFTWNLVGGAQAYRVTVGTSAGGTDVADSGSLPATQSSFSALLMAVDQTVFARLYVEIGGQWQYQQISFAAAWGGSSLTYPTSGQIPFSKSAQGYDVTQPFAWTATAGAQAYWVAIGSWQGSADVVSSGQLPASQTSWYLPISLAPGGTYYARLFTEVGGQWQFQDIVFTTGNSVVFTYPTSGQQNVDLTKPFKWTATGTAQAYWVTIGSTLGARDLASSGALPASQSSWQVPASLPTAQTLYARIWTEVGGQWQYQDSPFTVGSTSTSTSGTGGVTPSSLTYPTSGQQNVDPTKPFTWNATTGAQGYEVTIGTSQGAADVVDSGSLPASQTSWLVPTPLPTGKTLYARLSTEISGQWQYQDISFTAAANSVAFTYPTAGQQNVDTTKPFSWSGASAAQGYRVTIGTSQGAADVVDSGSLPASQTSWLVPIQLPTGKTLYARLYTEISGQWQYQDISFTAASSSTSTSTSTSTGSGPFTYPSDGQQGVDTTKPFTWNLVGGAQAYRVTVGTSAGGTDVADSGSLPATQSSFSALLMAVDQTVFARLYVEIGGQWQYQQISFAAAWGGSSLTYPTSGQIPFSKSAQGYDVTQPFAWTATAGAQAYWVAIGSWQGSADVVSSGQLPASQTSWYLPISLAPGGTYYARLFTEVGGQWQFQDIVFTTGNSVVFTYPTSGQQNVDLTKPFKWTATGTAQAYWVTIGSTLGARDLASSGALPASQSSWQVPASLPTAQTLYARIWTEVGGQWQYQDSPFTVGSTSTSTSGTGGVTPSSLTYPTSGQQNVDPTKPFTWNATTGAQGYEVTIGTSQGAADVVDSGSLPASQTSWLVPTPLPTGKTLYARLSTEISGQWQYQDISFTAAANSVAFTYPTAGQQNVDTTKPFSWSGASAAQGYRVTIGTSQGAADVVDSGSLPASQTSWLVPIQLPTGKTLYARLYTEISGQWQYQDISFTAASSSTSTSTSTSTGSGPFTYPSDGQQGVDTTKPFTWNLVGGAQAYRVTVGTSAGGTDVADSGSLPATQSSWLMAVLPPTSMTLYARFYSEISGQWQYQDISFTAASTGVAFTYPTAGEQNVDPTQAFTWTTTSASQNYDLTIGTTPGGDDVVNTGTLPGWSESFYVVPQGLPSGQTLYAQISVELNGQWFYQQISFTAEPNPIAFTYPTAGQQNVDTTQPFTWSTNSSAQGYHLTIGTSPGGVDLADSGTLPASQTSYVVPVLPTGETLYARLYTVLYDDYPQYEDVSFTVAPNPVAFTYPTAGQQSVDPAKPFTWSTSPAAQGYELMIGASPGAADFVDSGMLPPTQSSYAVRTGALPAGQTLYASLYTFLDGQRQYQGITFTAQATQGSPPPSNSAVIPFASTSPWVTPLPASPSLDPNSGAIVANLNQQLHDYYGHASLNTSSYSAPIYTVPADQPKINMTWNNCQNHPGGLDPGFAKVLQGVPVPTGAVPSEGTDADIVIWQPSTDTEWEFWKMAKDASTGAWSACWGGRTDNVSQSSGFFPYPYGVSASGASFLADLIRISELQSGQINHAIDLSVPKPRSTFSWPATRTDGTNGNPNDPAQGERFRLDPTFDTSTLPPGERMIAVAMQKYGVIVTDSSALVTVQAEDPRPIPGGQVAYDGFFPGNQVELPDIPWNRLQALVWNYGKPSSG